MYNDCESAIIGVTNSGAGAPQLHRPRRAGMEAPLNDAVRQTPRRYTRMHWKPVRVLVLGFAALIIAGALLLSMPMATRSGRSVGFYDALFTATSAVCVTGLSVVEVGQTFSLFGQCVLLMLIQAGGLGFMTVTSLVFMIMGRRITLRERLVIQEAMNESRLSGLVRLIRWVLLTTFIVELAGALLLSTRFIPDYGPARGLFYSLFHSVSAFCNAGFDILGNGNSMTAYADDWVVNLTLMGLIVLGGLGYSVIRDVVTHRSLRGLSLHSRVVLITSATLIVLGTVLFAALEWNNPATIGAPGRSGMDKLLVSAFQSVTTRTAGFATIDQEQMHAPSKLITTIFMFIGASPASTGGGVKTTTVAVLAALVFSQIRGRGQVRMGRKALSLSLTLRAISIFLIMLLIVLISTAVLSFSMLESQPFDEVLFETTSAIATVGLSCNMTPRLNFVSRLIVILMMFAGRVGPLSLTMALARQQLYSHDPVRYPEDRIMIG